MRANVLQLIGGGLYLDNQVVVKKPSDLEGTLSSSKVYAIDGVIDMSGSGISIRVPQGGLSIIGLGFGISNLKCTDNSYDLFVIDDTYSGNLFIQNLDIEISGTSSRVFNLDNQGNASAVELNTVNFNSCTSLGSLDEYRQFLGQNIGFFSISQGLECVGNWTGGFRLTTALARGVGSSIIIKAGTALVFNGRVLSDINMEGQSSATFTDMSASNIFTDGQLEVITANFNGVTNPIPNITGSNVKSRFRNCLGIKNTYVGGQWSLSSQVATVFTSVNPNKIAGTTTYTELQWFSNSTNNAFVYDSTQTIEVEVKGTLSFTGGNGDQIALIVRQWDNSASAYIDLSETGSVTMNAAGRAEGVSVLGFGTLDENDRIELWAENQTDTTSITMLLGGLLSVSERAS